jgi:hypothetical protein
MQEELDAEGTRIEAHLREAAIEIYLAWGALAALPKIYGRSPFRADFKDDLSEVKSCMRELKKIHRRIYRVWKERKD